MDQPASFAQRPSLRQAMGLRQWRGSPRVIRTIPRSVSKVEGWRLCRLAPPSRAILETAKGITSRANG